MIDMLMAFVAPHHCSGCGINGSLLCDDCKYNIISEPFLHCVACGRLTAGVQGICISCTVNYQRAWCVSERRDYLQRLIGNYKFTNARAAHKSLADLLHGALPVLPENTIIVPVPTVRSHIRQRGYDHVFLIARRFANLRGHKLHSGLLRQTTTKQRSASRAQRIQQAKQAFTHPAKLDPSCIYLIIDDVVTTGATMNYAAKTLRDAGAEAVWIASISRQPLD